MPAQINERCEQCGRRVPQEKDKGGLEVVDIGYGEVRTVCPECAEAQRASDAAHLEDGGRVILFDEKRATGEKNAKEGISSKKRGKK